MISPLNLTAEQILKSSALQIFYSESDLDQVYKALLKKWHPDVCPDPIASDVVSHINALIAKARHAYANGGYPDTLKIGGTLYPYIAVRPFELGELYICPRNVIWAVERQYDDLAKHWLDIIKGYKFPSDEVKTKITPFIPRNSHVKAYKDRAYVIIDRPHNFIRVRDIISSKGIIDPKHVAWTLSRAYNLAGFLHYNNITHMDISVDTFFIEPATHFGALLGGWFYSGNPSPIAAPSRSAHLTQQKGASVHDAQIRIMGRTMLGCNSISELRRNVDIPQAIKTWLGAPALDNIIEAERKWKDVIISAFGERKFTEYKLTISEIYSN